MSGQEGIDKLLAAESEATEIVSKARKEKTARIKQARDEAEAMIKKLRADMDRDFKNAEMAGTGGGEKSTKLAGETENQLAEIRRQAEANRVNVVRQILGWITTVDTSASAA
jgi:V-type H+-transporting ATPase subunit G